MPSNSYVLFPDFFVYVFHRKQHSAPCAVSESRLPITSSELKLPMSLVSTSGSAYESRQKSRHHFLSATACCVRLEDQSVTSKDERALAYIVPLHGRVIVELLSTYCLSSVFFCATYSKFTTVKTSQEFQNYTSFRVTMRLFPENTHAREDFHRTRQFLLCRALIVVSDSAEPMLTSLMMQPSLLLLAR